MRLDPAREAEIIEELSQHLDDRYDELRADGTSHAEARRLVIEELREAGTFTRRMRRLAQAQTPVPIAPGAPSGSVLSGLWPDLRYALRALRQHPGVTATIVLTLGIGIAVNTTVFTIVNAAVLRPFPFEEPDRVVQIGIGLFPDNVGTLSYPDLQGWQAATTTMELVGASRVSGMTIADDGRSAARLAGAYISWTMFPLLGVDPVIGRAFVEADDRAGAPPVVILGDDRYSLNRPGGQKTLQRLWRLSYLGRSHTEGLDLRRGAALHAASSGRPLDPRHLGSQPHLAPTFVSRAFAARPRDRASRFSRLPAGRR